MLEGTALTVLLAAASGAVAGNLLSFFAKRVDAIVRSTRTPIDDIIWETVRGAMDDSLRDLAHGIVPADDDDEAELDL